MSTHRQFDSDGYDQFGYDREGFNKNGYNQEGYHRSGTHHRMDRIAGDIRGIYIMLTVWFALSIVGFAVLFGS